MRKRTSTVHSRLIDLFQVFSANIDHLCIYTCTVLCIMYNVYSSSALCLTAVFFKVIIGQLVIVCSPMVQLGDFGMHVKRLKG